MKNRQSKWLWFSLFVIALLGMAACNMGGSNSGTNGGGGGNGGGGNGGGGGAQTSTLTFDIGEDTDCTVALDLRFFDKTANLQWPANDEVYNLNVPGQQEQFPLSCTTGHQVCYGASYYSNTDAPVYWGAGIDGTEGCPNCCYTCGDQTVNAPFLSCTVGPDAAGRRLKRRLAPSLKRLD
jgi:hypothetical protein